MKNPIQLAIVSAVPLVSAGAFCATKVDKSGESAITTMPQKNKKTKNKTSNSLLKMKGEIIQQTQDNSNEINAILFAPNFRERNPLTIQARPPTPIIKNENREILKVISGFSTLYFLSCLLYTSDAADE